MIIYYSKSLYYHCILYLVHLECWPLFMRFTSVIFRFIFSFILVISILLILWSSKTFQCLLPQYYCNFLLFLQSHIFYFLPYTLRYLILLQTVSIDVLINFATRNDYNKIKSAISAFLSFVSTSCDFRLFNSRFLNCSLLIYIVW